MGPWMPFQSGISTSHCCIQNTQPGAVGSGYVFFGRSWKNQHGYEVVYYYRIYVVPWGYNCLYIYISLYIPWLTVWQWEIPRNYSPSSSAHVVSSFSASYFFNSVALSPKVQRLLGARRPRHPGTSWCHWGLGEWQASSICIDCIAMSS